MHMCPLGHPYQNAEVISSQSLVDGVFISVKPSSSMHHWSSVNQQLLALQATLLPVLPSHKAFLMGGLSCEPSNWSAEHSWARCTHKKWNWCVARSRDSKVVHVGLALQWVPDTGEVVSWGKDGVAPRRYSSGPAAWEHMSAGLENAGGWWDKWNLGYGLCRQQKCQTLTWGCAAALWAMHSALSFSFIPAGRSCWLPQYFACGEYSVFEQLSTWREFLQTWRVCIWACIRGPGCWTACHLNAHSCKLICSSMASWADRAAYPLEGRQLCSSLPD